MSKCSESKAAPRRRAWRRALRAVLAAALAVGGLWLGFHLLSALFPFPWQRVEALRRANTACVVTDRQGTPLRAFLGDADTWLFWVPLDQVSLRLIQATVAVEDQRFFRHAGVDLLAVARAAVSNVLRLRVVSGASTLTMQLVRAIEPRPRTLGAKLVEAFRALQVERLASKRELLEAYVNLAPYGGNVLGVEAASLRYFGKHASDLTLDEAALIAGLPQSPSRLRPDRWPDRARGRRDHVLSRMLACGYAEGTEVARGQARPVRVSASASLLDAPHFARMARAKYPDRERLRTTLERDVQGIAEDALRERVDALRGDGVTNGAVVVIENETAAVRALVGSRDFLNEEDDGQVNGALAQRSPGSALKPFLYALAFDDGRATPDTVLGDVPMTLAGYEPMNYDRGLRGPVQAAEALALSLNVPAVALLREVGLPRFHDTLRRLGFTTIRSDPDRYGLALALGSAEVRLLDLTNAYACLARLGIARPCRILEDDPQTEGVRVFSEASAFLVAEALADAERARGQLAWHPGDGRTRMAWKTGTSHGHRDAWTVAFTPHYTVGVWLGNLNGRPAARLVGQTAAAPVAARILDQVCKARQAASWYVAPASVGERDTCADSGMALGPHCPRRARGRFIIGRSSPQTCRVHVEAPIDRETGAVLGPCCMSGRPYDLRVVECWPEGLAAWLRRSAAERPLAPPHFAGCLRRVATGGTPEILSPNARETYVLMDGPLATQRIPLKSAGAPPRLYWFVDGAHVAESAPFETVFWPARKGRHRIACADDHGRTASVTIEVR